MSVTSHLMNKIGGNSGFTLNFKNSVSVNDATSFPFASDKSIIVLKIPFCASATTSAFPMPEEPLVTNAERPGLSSISVEGPGQKMK